MSHPERRARGAIRRALPTVVLFAIALAASSACKSNHDTPAPPPAAPVDLSAFGQLAADDDVDFAPYLAAVRGTVTRTAVPPAPIPARPAQRVIVTLWAPTAEPIVATALGADLFASVVQASESLAKNAPSSFRIQLDVVKSVEPTVLDDTTRERLAVLGVEGFAAAANGKLGVVTPSEMIARAAFDANKVTDKAINVDVARLRALFATRASMTADELRDAKTFRFMTTSRLESLPPARAIPVARLLLPRERTMDDAALIGAVRAGADYLCRILDATGKYEYLYRPTTDRPDLTYGMLRHAGTTYALLEAWGELKTPLYRTKAELALTFLKDRTWPSPDGSYVTDSQDEEQQKVGGAGLALVAWAKHAELTGERSNLETMRKLGFFIVHQQYPDGHFRDNADVDREGANAKKRKAELPYYPGEALLGLLRLYALDPREMWLDAAKKGARFLIDTRDAGVDEDHLIHDQWLTYALLDLHRITGDAAYVEHMFKIARAVLKRQNDPERRLAPDYEGAFFDTGDSTASSTRLEVLATDIEVSRFTAKDSAWLDSSAMTLATFIANQQYDAQSAFFVRRPEKALGGVRESFFVPDIRIDYVQHAMSAWLHLARLLRDPAYGKKR